MCIRDSDTTVCAANGALVLDAKNPGYAYEWQDSSTDSVFSVTTTGDYWVIVSNVSCSDTDSVRVEVAGSAVLDLGSDTALCDSSLTLNATSAFSKITWQDGSTDSTLEVSISGTYYVDVEDTNGCVGSDTIVVSIYATPIVDLGPDTVTICTTSPDVTFDAKNPGSSYLWNTTDTTQTILKGKSNPGEYWVVATQNGCSDRDTVYLKVATELTVDLGEDINICPGIDAVLNTGFGSDYIFDWNSGLGTDSTFKSGKGEVFVHVEDSGGCFGKDTILITELNPLVINLGNDTSICFGDPALTISMLSGRTDVSVVSWQDGSNTGDTFTSVGSGWYWLEVDSSGCIYRDSLEFTVNPLPAVDLGLDTFICVGTTPVITLSGGVFKEYQWTSYNGASVLLGTLTTQDIDSVGTYILSVTDTNSCADTDTIQVIEKLGTAIGFDLDTTICPQGSATIEVPLSLKQLADVSWVWKNDNSSTPGYTVSNELDSSVVKVILDFTNASGCVTSDTVIVNVNNNLPISLRDTSICEGDTIVFNSGYPSLGYTYEWQDNSTDTIFVLKTAKTSDAGAVSVSIQSDEGCSGDTTVQLVVHALPDPKLSSTPICLGDSLSLNHGLTNVVSIWDHGKNTNPIWVTTAGTYGVTVTDGNNCVDTVSVSLVVKNPPSFSLPADMSLCEGESYALGTGMDALTHTHNWSGGSTATTSDILVISSGDYSVDVTDIATSCTTSDMIKFTFLDVPSVDLGVDTNLCAGEYLSLSSSGTDFSSYSIVWNTGSQSVSINADTSGWYWLEATNGSCFSRDSIEVLFYENPVSLLQDDLILCFDDMIGGYNLDPGRSGVYNYLWSTGDTTQVINITSKGTYLLELENLANCTTEDYIEIKEDCPAHVWLPNSFTPDNNMTNDVWIINGRGIETLDIFVFNRWGELIWEGNALGDFWDGRHYKTNKKVQQDIYVYHLKYTYSNVDGGQEQKQRVGRVALIR